MIVACIRDDEYSTDCLASLLLNFINLVSLNLQFYSPQTSLNTDIFWKFNALP